MPKYQNIKYLGYVYFMLYIASAPSSLTAQTAGCTVTYYAFGGQNDSGERIPSEDLEGAMLYFLDIDNWPGENKLSSLSFAGGGIVSKAKFEGGKATVVFPEGHHKVTIAAVQQNKRYWAFLDKKALPTYGTPPLHDFYCASGKISPRR
jgi:hypothetical protein